MAHHHTHTRAHALRLIGGVILAMTLFVLLPAGIARAATIEFATSETVIGAGSEIEVSLLFSTETLVNAIEIGVRIPEQFEYVGVSDGNSIINFWVEEPSYSSGSRTFFFSGIVPGGFAGERAKLLDIRIRAPQAGSGTFALTDRSSVFVHGPDGVREAVRATPLSIQVVRDIPARTDSTTDTTSPEPFTPAISRDPALFDGRPFVTFATQDKGSGIARYEIQERSIDMAVEGAWRTVESPALLDDAERNSYVFVRAIDRAGNVRTAIIPPLREGSFLTIVLTMLFTALLIPLVFSLYNRVRRYEGPTSHAS